MLTSALQALGQYAEQLLAASVDQRAFIQGTGPDWRAYHRLISRNDDSASRPLRPIADAASRGEDAVLPRVPLALTEAALFPRTANEAGMPHDWDTERRTLARVVAGLSGVADSDAPYAFEPLAGTMRRLGTNLAATLAGPTLSLYQQFAIVSAFFAASNGAEVPASEFVLVTSDTPGIQRLVGGAAVSRRVAKGLRGRSLFLQLLTDAIARRTLDAFELPCANLLYAAGGNFLLLAPASADEQLRQVSAETSQTLLEISDGELDQAFAWLKIEPGKEAWQGRYWERQLRTLRTLLSHNKLRPYASPLGDPDTNYDRLFGVETEKQRRNPSEGKFAELAERFRADTLETPRYLHRERTPQSACADEWQRDLHRVSKGWRYTIDSRQRSPSAAQSHLTDALNRPEAVPAQATGFRFLGTTTPLAHAGEGQIREVSAIAGQTPMSRIGVLRMDVDGLGTIFSQGLQPAHLATVCTLSAALDTFFAGWLNVVCEEVQPRDNMPLNGRKFQDAKVDRGDLLYTIYSGGDDLFIIGAWDRLPVLAQRLREDFTRYCAKSPAFRLSGGIAIEGERYPIYQLAKDAADALDSVKALKAPPMRGYNKDAISLFGHIVPWERFDEVRALVDQLMQPAKEPSALFGRLLDLASLDISERERLVREEGERRERRLTEQERQALGLDTPDPYGATMAVIGRAKWRGLVALRRAIEQYRGTDRQLANVLREVEERVLAGTITPHLALAVRWADYLWRESNVGQKRGEE